LESYF